LSVSGVVPIADADQTSNAPVSVTVPFTGNTAARSWTYYGGPFWVNNIRVADNGKTAWLATPVGLVRYDVKRQELCRWTTLDGLADNTVYDIDLDRKGNVWAATMSGVSRFDGKRFRNWYAEDIGHNAFGTTAVDVDGRVWVGCTGRYRLGAFCLAPSGAWTQYSAWALHENGGFLNDVRDIQPDPGGGTWLCGSHGGLAALEGSYQYHTPWGPNLYYIDPYGTADVVPLPKDDDGKPLWPHRILIDAHKNVFMLCNTSHRIISGSTLYRLQSTDRIDLGSHDAVDVGTGIAWEKAVTAPNDVAGKIEAGFCDDTGQLWLATAEGVGRLVDRKFQVVFPLPIEKLRSAYQSFATRFVVFDKGQQALCFFVFPTGFFHFRNGQWTHIDTPLDGPVRNGRGFPIIGRTGRGPDGNMYFVRNTTTTFDGREWRDLKRRTFFVRDRFDRVRALYWQDPAKREDVIWVTGTDSPVPMTPRFNGSGIRPQYVDSKGHYWQLDKVVLEFDGETAVDHVPANPYLFREFAGYYNRRASRVIEDDKNRLYIATQWGLLRRIKDTRWIVVGSKFNGMLGMSLWQFAGNGRDTISFGGPWGSSDYNTRTDTWTNVINKSLKFPGTRPEYPGTMVEYVAADLQGRMWYGFYEAGVVCRETDGTLTHLTTRDGLPNNSVWGIWADDDGSMWFNTFSGTVHYDATKTDPR